MTLNYDPQKYKDMSRRRNGRQLLGSESDSEGYNMRPRRAIRYEESLLNEDLEGEIDAPKRTTRRARLRVKDDDDEVEDEELSALDDEILGVKPVRRSKRGKVEEPDDSDFHSSDEISEISDDFLQREQENAFVASDDDGADYGYGKRRKRRKTASRSKSGTPETRGRRRQLRSAKVSDLDSDANIEDSPVEEDDTIREEINDLFDSPEASPVRHNLRQRQVKVDYTIPPPITNDAELANLSALPERGRPRRQNINKNEYRKLLFPTAGPFGGSDVVPLFGKGVSGSTGLQGNIPIGQMSDSDSSDDEIKPINGTNSGHSSSLINNTKLITGGTNEAKGAKKNNLSDTDPLGVDMNIDFSAVGGLDSYIDQLKEMVTLPLLYPELYQNFNISPPRGVLFHGPPGTGKTLMARALAATCSTSTRKITFFMRKGADALSKWVGEAERQLRLLFEEAKKQQPSIIFFDEIDGLAPVRSSKQEQIHASIVSTLLALMDGMDNRGPVIVIGATNRPDSIDPALRRPGRFDREFYFPLPDEKARAQILRIQTKKWNPPLSDEFINKVAGLTKGYGGADLRALCVEASLMSIQRKYPQIYQTSDKLQVDPSKVKVVAKDFMKAIDKIVPSSARLTASGSAPLPDNLLPLLEGTFNEIKSKLEVLLPDASALRSNKKTDLEEAMYLDPTVNDEDGGFGRQNLLKNLEDSRICKPHLLISGLPGNGQQYLGPAILNHLEGFQIQLLDLGTVFGDVTRTPELAIVQAFIEARRHQPSILFLPNIDVWYLVMPYSARATLASLLRGLKSTEKVLLLGISETPSSELDHDINLIFGFESPQNNVHIDVPSRESRIRFFKILKEAIKMRPFEFINDFENRPKRKLKKLKVVSTESNVSNDVIDKKRSRQIEYEDTKLKNLLKIKLAGLMDLFKTRYKRFRKPIIDENLLYHLFEPSVLEDTTTPYEVLYTRSEDPEHENMIREVSTGRYYYNMDLDIIEERLWNGYYSEPKQFVKDIRMILKDSITSEDRERLLKANEMLTNAEVAIDEFSTPDFLASCKEMREREKQKQERMAKEYEAKEEENLKEINKEIPNGESEPHDSTKEESDVVNETEKTVNGEAEKEDVSKEVPEAGVSKEAELSEEVQEKQLPNVNNGDTKETEPDVVMEATNKDDEEETSASEAEEEIFNDELRQVEVGSNFDDFFENELPNVTENFSVEKLELLNARLMDIIWNSRKEWDKTSTMDNLAATAKRFA